MDSFIHILIPAGSHFTHNTLVYLPCFEIASNKLHIMCRISSFFKLLQYSVDMGCLCKSPMFKKKIPDLSDHTAWWQMPLSPPRNAFTTAPAVNYPPHLTPV